MAKPLTLRVMTPAETILEAADVAQIQLQVADGSLGIWPGHAPLLAQTVRAPLHYTDETGEHALNLESGILHIDQTGVTILTGGLVAAEAESGQPARHFERLAQACLAEFDGS